MQLCQGCFVKKERERERDKKKTALHSNRGLNKLGKQVQK